MKLSIVVVSEYNATGEDGCLDVGDEELSLKVLGQEHNEARDNHELHAGSQAGHHINGIHQQLQHWQWNVWKKREKKSKT